MRSGVWGPLATALFIIRSTVPVPAAALAREGPALAGLSVAPHRKLQRR